MNHTSTSIATAIAGVIALGSGSLTISAQVTVDVENRYSNVGAIMVWRVDDAGQAVELRGFASGTLIRDRVMVTAGHFTAPATALGTLPPSIRIFASFSPTDAKDPKTWIPVVRQVTHPSMPHCPPPPQCDPTDEILVAPLEPGIADVGLVFLAYAPPGIGAARLAEPGTLDRSEGASTTIVGYGTTTPRDGKAPPDPAMWDGKRRIRTSILRKVVDETWGLWSIPSYVCSGDSGGGIFLHPIPSVANQEVLAANVSDGGLDCRRHNNNNRLDTHSIQKWISETLRQSPGGLTLELRCSRMTRSPATAARHGFRAGVPRDCGVRMFRRKTEGRSAPGGGSSNPNLRCSFCGKTQDQVRKLAAGPKVFICDECVEVCVEIMADTGAPCRTQTRHTRRRLRIGMQS